MDSQNVEPEGTPVQAVDLRAEGSTGTTVEARTTASNPFCALWDGGYTRLVPIVPPDAELSPYSSLAKRPGGRGKAVGELGEHGWRGMDWHHHVTVEADLDRWHAMGAGTGCRMGDGLVAVDIDALDKAQSLAVMEAAFKILGPAPRRIGRAPKMLLLYRCSTDIPYQRVEFKGLDGKTERVEVLGPGQQAVFLGIHPGTMKQYSWPDGLPERDELPEITPDQMRAYLDRLVEIMPEATRPTAANAQVRDSVDQDALVGDLEAIRAAVVAIPNDRSDRQWFLRMGYAIKASLRDYPDEAFDLFWEWCERWTVRDKDYDSAWSFWTSLRPPFAVGADYLYGEAAKRTGENMTPSEKHFDVVLEGSVDTSAFSNPRATPQKPALAFVGLGEWADGALTTRARPLIKNLLDQGAMTVLYGESNVGKTFVAMDMAFHVAMGMPWGGMKTTQKLVAYIAAEGGQGARKRGAALIAKYGACADFRILPKSVDLLRADADVRPLIEALKDLGDDLGLVVVDTLSRAMAGGNENDSTDMGAVVRHLDAIRNATGAHVLVVHHSGKDKTRGARGHSLLRAATDTEIEVSEGQIDVTKQRDLEKTYASAFDLDVVTLGADEDGDPVTSCTLRLISKHADITPGVATPKESQILQGLNAWADTSADPRAGVLQADFLIFLGKPKSEAENVRGHLKSLRAKNLVEKVARGRWRTTCRSGLDENAFFKVQEAENTPVQSGGSTAAVGVFQ